MEFELFPICAIRTISAFPRDHQKLSAPVEPGVNHSKQIHFNIIPHYTDS